MGGVAIWLACIIALLVFTDAFKLPQLGAILLGASLVAATGLFDDRRGLSPYVKLGMQALAASIVIFAGVRVESATPWFAVNIVLTVVWIVGITNALNLLDNMDGLAAGVATISGGFFLLLAAGSGQILVASLAAAIAGASLGYLRFNFLAPARIFMGDAGSLFLGFILAVLGIKLHFDKEPVVTWLIPILVLGIPIFDTTLVVVSRLRRHLNPLTTPGKDHLSHRLVLAGLSSRESVLVIHMIGGMLGMVAMFIAAAGTFEAAIIAAAVGAFVLFGFLRLEAIYRRSMQLPVPTEAGSTSVPVSPG
jgi:UDP-GlcNAc:undecaprenyl-phosphate GlcNAc-1-phosphate transferase